MRNNKARICCNYADLALLKCYGSTSWSNRNWNMVILIYTQKLSYVLAVMAGLEQQMKVCMYVHFVVFTTIWLQLQGKIKT